MATVPTSLNLTMPIELHGLVPFAGFTLAAGRALLLVASVEPVADDNNQMLETALAKVLEQVPDGVDLGAVDAPRMLVGGNNAQGDRFVWDVAVTAPATG